MKVFISWSGEQAKHVARALRDWLPQVLQSVEPFVSSEDIDKGARWNEELTSQLEDTNFGVICVTRDNQHASWLNYEAGAIGKAAGSRVACVLIDLPPSDVTSPLKAFQHTLPDLSDVIKLVKSINAASESPIRETVIESLVPRLWDDVATAFAEAQEPSADGSDASSREPQRSPAEMLGELVDLTRDIHRRVNVVPASFEFTPSSTFTPSASRIFWSYPLQAPTEMKEAAPGQTAKPRFVYLIESTNVDEVHALAAEVANRIGAGDTRIADLEFLPDGVAISAWKFDSSLQGWLTQLTTKFALPMKLIFRDEE